MHNSAQTDIIITLIAFAAVWFLVSYIFYKIRKNDEPDDDSGVIKRDELAYITKFNRTIRAMIISFMYDDYKLHTHIKCSAGTQSSVSNLVRAKYVKNDIKVETKWIKQPIVNDLLRRNMIEIARIDDLETSEATIVYKLKPMAVVWCFFTLLFNRSIVKTIKELEYLKV